MTIAADDLGLLGSLGTALGFFDADGDPEPGWLGDPGESLSTILADDGQREALVAFVDEALGGADRTTESGVVWLPVLELDDPDLDLFATIDDRATDRIGIGIAARFSSTDPTSHTWISIPLFRASRVGHDVASPLWLGQPGARITLACEIATADGEPEPGEAHIGAVAIEIDLPTSAGDDPPSFALTLSALQLPGSSTPSDLRIALDNTDDLDDALLEVVLGLIRDQAASVGGDALSAVAGLLGLGGDAVDDFPIEALLDQGVAALGRWLEAVLESTTARQTWLDHLAALLQGVRNGDRVELDLGAATVAVGVMVDTGPSGNSRLTPTVAVVLGDADQRVEVDCHPCRIDLVTGQGVALPRLGFWAAAGTASAPVLDVTSPSIIRAETLRIGGALDTDRRLVFVLAADEVMIGTEHHPVLDLTSADAVMTAAGDVVDDLLEQLLAGLGDALATVRILLGLDVPAGHPGAPTVAVSDLMTDPLGTLSDHWASVSRSHRAVMADVLARLLSAVGDASTVASPVTGAGTADDPWLVPLITVAGTTVEVQVAAEDGVITATLAGRLRVDDLGQRCTVLETSLAATVAEIDLDRRDVSLLPGVSARLTGRERGVDPPRVTLPLGDLAAVTASHLGIELQWTVSGGVVAAVLAPDLALIHDGVTVPLTLPEIGPDGSVTLSSDGWDALQTLIEVAGTELIRAGGAALTAEVGHGLLPLVLDVLGWTGAGPRLNLADLFDDPSQALSRWLAAVVSGEQGAALMALVTEVLGTTGDLRAVPLGSGHPDDPYRINLAAGLPLPALWFTPGGLERRPTLAPDFLRNWRPGHPPLPTDELAAAIRDEAIVDPELADMVRGRGISEGLEGLVARWTGGDGRIAPADPAPADIEVLTRPEAAGGLLDTLDLELELDRVPATVVNVAIGADAWPDAPADRLIDLSAANRVPASFAAPSAATGEWFVALGERAACRLPDDDPAGPDPDGTAGQAARLRVVLDALAPLGNDLVLVAVHGAGHAARSAAAQTPAVSDLFLVGTPLGPISLSVLTMQPNADALRLLHRLLPEAQSGEDPDLRIGRGLINSLMDLTDRVDPGSELRPAPTSPPTRPGLTIRDVMGSVSETQVRRSITAVVAAGLAARARLRAELEPTPVTGAAIGLHLPLAPDQTGSLLVEGDVRLTLASIDAAAGLSATPMVRVRLWVGDRLGWLTAGPEHELRMFSVDATIDSGDLSASTATLVFHDARVGSQSWGRLVVGGDSIGVPLLPEARVLLDTVVQRLVADAGSLGEGVTSTVGGLVDGARALGLIANGGAVHDAFDHLIHDVNGLVADALTTGRGELSAAVADLLGPGAGAFDLTAGTVSIRSVAPDAGPFGWSADLTVGFGPLVGTAGGGVAGDLTVSGTVTIGTAVADGPGGALQLVIDFNPTPTDGSAPVTVEAVWHRVTQSIDRVPLWPAPDGAVIAATLARALPGLAAQTALELVRGADEDVRPLVDALLDTMGMLRIVGDSQAVRPLHGFFADPGAWLRHGDSIGLQPANAQALIDGLRPFMGFGGDPGDPIEIAPGAVVTVMADGPGLRLAVFVDGSAFTAPGGSTGRLTGSVAATLAVGTSGPPGVGLEAAVGLAGADTGRQAVHVALNGGSLTAFIRPTVGADITLVPFAGFGGLVAAAEAALPFLLDELSDLGSPVGPAVTVVGDALGLRSGDPARFDGAALQAWAADPVAALTVAVPSIVAASIPAVAAALDDLVPGPVSAAGSATELTVAVGPVTLHWTPTTGTVQMAATGVAVPGVGSLSLSIAVSDLGIQHVLASLGPAAIAVGSLELRPFALVAAGLAPPGGAGIELGLAKADGDRFGARWLFTPIGLDLVAGSGGLDQLDADTDPAAVTGCALEILLDLVAAMVIATDAVQDLLDFEVGTGDLRDILANVVLDSTGQGLLPDVFDPDTLLDRSLELFENLAGAGPSITIEGLTLSLLQFNNRIGVQVGLAQRFELVTGQTMLWLETNDRWIATNPPGDGGVFVSAVSTIGGLSFEPGITVNGVGLRIGAQSGPLLDTALTLESVAFHTYAEIDDTGFVGGGLQVELSELAVAADGASGGNSIAQGIMADTGSQPPQPAFSPALAVQKRRGESLGVTLRAGEGDGPWWVGIRKGFGPIYLEQIGFGAVMPSGTIERISILFDGSVSMIGLQCAVDDLEITYLVSRNDFFNPSSWEIDLAGLAVSADLAGVRVAGGLLKSTDDDGNIEYLGMLLARFSVYGITIYGGYGEGVSGGQRFVSFFAVGAVVGPIGGPPAFFLTGIGGGFGINRELIVPTDMSQFGDYPLIKALDTGAAPGNPMEELRALGAYFPMRSDTFWFAAGISFTSFVIVDAIAVVAVEIGDGLDISLLGLAQLALPRPEVALVSIELALLARFSSSEGVIWVQGQLTDNSYLLYRDVKLTGGFAYVMWFKGPNRGQFVITMGGYHPDFTRPDYPLVPRLGLEWKVSNNIVIKAGGYFALTSEAVMAGGDFEASAEFGPAWAEVKFGAHGIVYFDPFHYRVNAYARIAAGVTVDLWILGEVTFSINIGASIEVEGPDFHGKATFEVGPVELEVEFGSRSRHIDPPLSPAAFIGKYLDRGAGGGAVTTATVTSFGTVPAPGGAATPDGNADRPYLVSVEFGLVVTGVVPSTRYQLQGPDSDPVTRAVTPSRTLGVAPMDVGVMGSGLVMSWRRGAVLLDFPFAVTTRPLGAFPVGVWGPPQDPDHRPLPKGDVIEALTELELAAVATPSGGGPEIPFHQVEIGQRLPLPFARTDDDTDRVRTAGVDLAGLVAAPTTTAEAYDAAHDYLAATASPTALAALRRERQAPPLVGTLGEGLDTVTNTVIPATAAAVEVPPVDHSVHAPQAAALLPASGAVALGDPSRAGARRRTTVTLEPNQRPWRRTPPTLATVDAERPRSIATGLKLVEPPATVTGSTRRSGTVAATGDVPPSEMGRAAPAMVRTRGGDGASTLDSFTRSLRAGRRSGRGRPGAVLGPGDVAVLRLPNAARDAEPDAPRPALELSGGSSPVRVVGLANGGGVITDDTVTASWTVPPAIERIVVVGLGQPDDQRPVSAAGLDGWHAAARLPYVGWARALGPGCVVHTRGERIRRHRQRVGAGWIGGAELAAGNTTVTTRFTGPVTSVVVVLDDPELFTSSRGRELLLGLIGAKRAVGPDRTPRQPVVVIADNRSVIAYDIVPEGSAVSVSVASEEGWSLVGVLGSTEVDAKGAAALITARGLDGALNPLAAADRGLSRLIWRAPDQRDPDDPDDDNPKPSPTRTSPGGRGGN